MKDKLRILSALVKLSIPVLVLVLTINTFSVSWLSLTSAWFTSQVKAVSNKVESGYWTPDSPELEGWNLETDSTNPDDTPTDLTCGQVTNGGDPDQPRASFVWTEVAGSNIVYQREVTYPDGHTRDDFYHDQYYTEFGAFGSDQGIDGTWTNRVRAFEDVNDNGVYDAGTDVASPWSSECSLTLDTTGPVLNFTNLPRSTSISVNDDNNLDVEGSIEDRGPTTYTVKLYADDGDGSFDSDDSETDKSSGVESRSDADGSNFILHELNFDDLTSGDYWVVLEAEDDLGNSSQLVEKIELTRDDNDSQVTVTNSPTRLVTELLDNESFEYGLDSWTKSDQVELELVSAEQEPHHGQQFVSLGSEQTLVQTIDNRGQGIRSVGFWYQLKSDHNSDQANEAGFKVYANDQLMAQYQQPTGHKWQFASVYLAELEADQIEFKIETGDNIQQVALDDFSTKRIVVNPEAVFTLTTAQPEFTAQVFYQYRLNGRLIQKQGQPGLDFTLPAQPDQGLVEHWSVNQQGQTQDRKQIYVVVDKQAPTAITDLRAYDENDSEYSLSFTAPADDQFEAVREYDIRYSTTPITANTEFNKLPQAKLILDNSSQTHLVPATAGQTEDVMLTDLEPGQDYYFALKALDQAGNVSQISNIAQSKQQTNPEQFADSSIMINEIMYQPQTNPTAGDTTLNSYKTKQWVELYNQSDQDIDLGQWIIRNQAEQQVSITAERADNNRDLIDQGETVVPAQGWLVVLLETDFLAADDGQISLLNPQEQVVNSYQYQGKAQTGQTEARLVDAGEHWSLSALATPVSSNQNDPDLLQPQVQLYSTEADHVQLEIIDASGYHRAQYELSYDYSRDDKDLTAGIQGEIDLDSRQVKSDPLFLGTCSGQDCLPHPDIKAETVKVEVRLYPPTDPDVDTQTKEQETEPVVIEAELEGELYAD